MIYVTGDCHADFSRFSTKRFPQQKFMMRDDFVIVCGDFGLWNDDPSDRYRLDWLAKKDFTLLFVDGNHENFDRLYGDEFEVVDFHGGKAHKIRDNVYHLMRGYIFDLCGKSFFAFGGARSHDIKDGILEPDNYSSKRDLMKDFVKRTRDGEMLRINHISWWKEELPSDEEMEFGLETLEENGNKVDYIVTHCCPQHVASALSHGKYAPDKLTEYFNKISEAVTFNKWYFGHYHDNKTVLGKYIMHYDWLVRIE